MDQRRPRLGDIVDDYCTRERRLTNHAVVAMVGEDIKQTRCTTCDTEHPYKGAKVPAKRKRPSAAAKADPSKAPPPVADELEELDGPHPLPAPHIVAAEPVAPDPPPPVVDELPQEGDSLAAEGREDDDGPVHRHRLIRATLPRVDGQKDPRQPPEFTMRQPGARGASIVGGTGGNGFRSPNARQANGNVATPHGKHRRPKNNRPGNRPGSFAPSSQRQFSGAGSGQPRNRRGGNKRSR